MNRSGTSSKSLGLLDVSPAGIQPAQRSIRRRGPFWRPSRLRQATVATMTIGGIAMTHSDRPRLTDLAVIRVREETASLA
jgi:anti-sigma-K factor RskA